ncbi:NAD(P)/FAD-dependent oxidoreductase [Parahaliea aestuarii]|uniref:FAD-dependent oxidoreductase n=1 Tax=Parahaliea aestuarii TaxID=1852021 RepID=A0A5C8ZXJ7_9GAMM|nr:FAD-dependent oxidoreductase [Parahaliea aestuarii]TXS92484.1 FAD-dependent oxidoreductase [Parahaliea aestuarii]
MSVTQLDTVVIGAGVVGTCIAERLQQQGEHVVLLDRAGVGEGCSSGNAGHFATDVVLPLANPQTLLGLPKMLLDPIGPLSLRWSYLPRMTPWLLRFGLAALPGPARQTTLALRALNSRSIESFERLFARTGLQDLMIKRGALTVYESAASRDQHRATVALLREHGVVVEGMSGDELRAMEPALAQTVHSGLFFPNTAHTVNPLRLTQALANCLTAAGGEIRSGEAGDVRSLVPMGEGVELALGSGERLQARRAVVCAGAFSARLLKSLGLRVPLETERGYHLMLPDPAAELSRPVTSHERSFVMTPMEHGLRLAGTVELAGLEAEPDYRRADILLEHAGHLLQNLSGAGASRWMGFRPSLPDSLPVIGAAPGMPQLMLAFGHQHLGLTQAAITAEMVSDLVAGRRPEVDPHPYRIERFRGARG